ncbi:MAG TPA: hypothetical protein VFA77_16500 [Candidatus Eisenbacteria bacterium]|nr:hypothetical protein [Candidatus Eisenbacteria bacterium]
MKLTQSLIACLALSLLIVSAFAQDPNVKHYDKDGLSFDYPANWQFSDQSTGQMQFLELTRGDLVLRVRSPREWLKTPEKEAAARKLFQDQYVDGFATQFEQQGLQPKRSAITTTIAGANADGTRLRVVMDRQPGGLDSYYLILSDRMVNLSILGGESDITKAAPVWDLIRNSLKIAPPPQPSPKPGTTPKSSATPKP